MRGPKRKPIRSNHYMAEVQTEKPHIYDPTLTHISLYMQGYNDGIKASGTKSSAEDISKLLAEGSLRSPELNGLGLDELPTTPKWSTSPVKVLRQRTLYLSRAFVRLQGFVKKAFSQN